MKRIRSDYHIHTDFSGDCETPMRDMVEAGIAAGLSTMCITEHMDMDAPDEGPICEVDTDKFYHRYIELKEEYEGKIELLFGIELGLQTHLVERHEEYVNRYPFDFIIGSAHLADGKDPFYPDFFEGKEEDDCYRQCFESIVKYLKAFSNVDTLGHLDYVVRYGPNKNKYYTYAKFQPVIDEVLKILIEKGIALEVNTGGYRYGLEEPNPCIDILKAYKSFGGESITIGSDAHNTKYLAYEFDRVQAVLRECGFEYYTEFRKRKPEFIRLG